LMKRFVCEKSEGESLFGVCGDAEVRGRQHFGFGESRGKLGKDERIAGAAAGDDELEDFVFAGNEAVEGVHHREGGENGSSADEIGGLGVMATPQDYDSFHIIAALGFPAGGFWRREVLVTNTHYFLLNTR